VQALEACRRQGFGSCRLADEERRDSACRHGYGVQQADRRHAQRVAHARDQHGSELRDQRAADDPDKPWAA
jgi:hypothetical protein